MNKYVSWCAEMLLESKSKTDILDVNMQLQLTDEDNVIFMGMEEAARTWITQEIKIRTQALTFNLISGFHLIASFKAKIISELMKKQGQLFVQKWEWKCCLTTSFKPKNSVSSCF